MRRVSKAGAILALLAILTPAIYADEAPPGTEPPQMRIGPPTGVLADDESQMRIGPPTGAPADDESQVRIAPPTGVAAEDESPTLLDLLLEWLQMRIMPPIG